MNLEQLKLNVDLDTMTFSVDTQEPCTLIELLEANIESWRAEDLVEILSLEVGEILPGGMGADVQRIS